MPTTVVFADDHEIVRYGLTLLLNGEPDLEVVGEAANAPQTLQLVESLRPEVLLLDLYLPGATGLSLVNEVRQRYPDVKIVMLSGQATVAAVHASLQAGVSGFVRKDDEVEEMIKAIRAAVSGERYLSPYLAQSAYHAYVEGTGGEDQRKIQSLTEREREVIQLAATGLTSAEIARQLYISPRTVETHRARAMQKLGLRNEVELGRFFLRVQSEEA